MNLPFFIEKKLAKKGQLYTIVELKKFDAVTGKIIKVKKFVGHSLTANYLTMLYAQLNNATASVNFPANQSPFNADNHRMLSISGTYATVPATNPRIDASTGVLTKGIVLGRGAQAITPYIPAVNNLIAHGTGANQMTYNQQISTNGVCFLGNQSYIDFQRSVVNNSGSAISVSEVAIYIDYAAVSFMIYYDAVTPAENVNNLQGFTISIRFAITT